MEDITGIEASTSPPISLTMSIDKPVYNLTDPEEPNLIFTATSLVDRPITLHIKGSPLDPDGGNVWKKHPASQLFEAIDTASGRKIAQPFYQLSRWTRRDPDKPLSFTNRSGEEINKYYEPKHTYHIILRGLRAPPGPDGHWDANARASYQTRFPWWFGTKEELLSSVGPRTRFRDLRKCEPSIRLEGIPHVEVTIEE